MFGIRTSRIASGTAANLVGLSAAIIMVCTLALGFVLFIFLYSKLKVRLVSRSSLLLIPALWIITEYCRSLLFSIVCLGPTGKIGAFWTYGDFGYLLGSTPLTFIGRLGGLYLLGFIVVLLAVTSIRVVLFKDYKVALMVALVVFVLALFGWLPYRQVDGKRIKIAAISYADEKEPKLSTMPAAKVLAARPIKPVDVFVLPEYSGFFTNNPPAHNRLLQQHLNKKAVVIDSQKQMQESYVKNMLTFANYDGKVLGSQPKWFTIPAGEYIPYIYQVLLAYAGQEQLLLDFRNQHSVAPGSQPIVPFWYDGTAYGSLVCSGITSPEFYQSLSNEGAEILTNSAALGTLGVSNLHHIQAQTMARRYAVDNARPFVQSAKDAPAYIYDYNGILLAKSKGEQIIVASVQTNRKKTPYSKFGNWILIVSLSLLLMLRSSYLHKYLTNIMIKLINRKTKEKYVKKKK
ncbi:MAG: nitrilase-related carbon-nitrogen hydrolase [Candidatus Saccharibacteria bacterium]